VGAVSGGEGSVWAADPGDGTIARIDVGSSAAVDRIPLGGRPGSVVSGAGAIWAASTVGGSVVRLDPATGSVTQTISIPGSNPDAMAIGRGELWITDSVARRLFEIDARSGSLRRSVPLGLQPSGVAVADNAIWISGYDTGTVEKLDPATGRTIGRVGVGGGPVALVSQAGALWVANQLDGTISRIDPEALVVNATIPVGSGPSALAAAGGSVWVANQYSGDVVRIGTRRSRIAESVEVGGAPTSLTIDAGRLWVGVGADAGSHRGGTLVMVTTQRIASADPADYGVATSPQFIGLAYDTLVTFAHSGGSDGLRLVPDLALAIPTRRDRGRTYTFRLRPGIRYSDGRRVRAGDFRRAIERLFRAGGQGASFFAGVVGAAACTRTPATCDLARGIRTDDARGVVTFRLSAPDAEFPFKLSEQGYSAPIPAGTPDPGGGADVPPGTGPYRIAAITHGGVRFTRNPYFREWSHAAQPAGNPDAIVWRYAHSARAAVAAVEAGRADWLFGRIPPTQYRALQLRDASRLHSTPQFAVDFLPLNTHRPPFDDVRVRHALNFAIDRGRIAQMYGGPAFADPTCQPLSPGLPGYRRYCPYTLRARRDGAWTAPDLIKARRLVAASGTRGQRIDLWGMTDAGYVPPAVSTYVAGVLRSLGYRVRLHLVSSASVSEAQRRQFQLSTDGDWQADYPDPSSYLPQFFACGGGDTNGYYCNPTLDREMLVASRLRLAAPAKADALWQSIDHQLTDRAAWVPTVNLHEVDVVSSRLHDYHYNPVWGFLPDQSWLGRH
jgi:YVTN family beta-propeller protein